MADCAAVFSARLEHCGPVGGQASVEAGQAAAAVQAILQLGSPQFPRRHGNPEDYLRRTVARAAFPARKGSVYVPDTLNHKVTL